MNELKRLLNLNHDLATARLLRDNPKLVAVLNGAIDSAVKSDLPLKRKGSTYRVSVA